MSTGQVQLILGDCLDVMPTLPPQCAQMVFADLPYGMVRRPWDTPIDLQQLWSQFLRLVRVGRFCFTAIMPFAATLIMSNPKLFRHDIVWDKQRSTGFLNANKRPMRQHEQVLVFAKGSAPYNPQKTQGIAYTMQRRSADNNFMQNVNNEHVTVSNGERFPGSILRLQRNDRLGLHPTQKPIALIEWLIRTYTDEGDTILDPTAGSGTAAIAALRTGRNVICIEKDEDYYDLMFKRVAAEQARLSQAAPCSQ